jgi:hypothetical protein
MRYFSWLAGSTKAHKRLSLDSVESPGTVKVTHAAQRGVGAPRGVMAGTAAVRDFGAQRLDF